MTKFLLCSFSLVTILWASSVSGQTSICPLPADIRVAPTNPSSSYPVSVVVTLDAVHSIRSDVSQTGNQILVELEIYYANGFPPPPGSISHTVNLGRLNAGGYDLVIQGSLVPFPVIPCSSPVTLPLVVGSGVPVIATPVPVGGAWTIILMIVGAIGALQLQRKRPKHSERA